MTSSIRSNRSLALLSALGIGFSCVPGAANAQSDGTEIEVVRGTRKDTVEVGADTQRIDASVDARADSATHGPGGVEVGIATDRYSIGGNERAEIRGDVRALVALYDKYLGVRVSADFRVNLEVMGDRRAYEERQGIDLRSAGFYRHSTGETVVSGGDDRAFNRETMVHESSHAILGNQFPGAPQWLNEGLAEYFESMERSGGRVRIPRQAARRHAVRQQLDGPAGAALDRLVGLANEEWNGQADDDLRLSYDQAWSVVYMLMESSRSREVLVRLLRGETESSAEAIERHYPNGLRGFVADWRRWLSSGGTAHTYY